MAQAGTFCLRLSLRDSVPPGKKSILRKIIDGMWVRHRELLTRAFKFLSSVEIILCELYTIFSFSNTVFKL